MIVVLATYMLGLVPALAIVCGAAIKTRSLDKRMLYACCLWAACLFGVMLWIFNAGGAVKSLANISEFFWYGIIGALPSVAILASGGRRSVWFKWLLLAMLSFVSVSMSVIIYFQTPSLPEASIETEG